MQVGIKEVLSFKDVLPTSGKYHFIILILAKVLEKAGTDHYFLLPFCLESLERAKLTRPRQRPPTPKTPALPGNNPDVPQQVSG